MLRRATVALFLSVALLVGAGAVFADDGVDADPEGDTSGMVDGMGAGNGAPVGEKGAAMDAAMQDVPTRGATYQGDLLYPTYEGETPHESFMRLAEDFLYVSEIGARRHPGLVPVWPRGAVKAGPFQIFPYLQGAISWTNNVNQDEGERSSWYWSAGGGFTGAMTFAGGKGSVGFGFDYNHNEYLQGDVNNTDEYVGGVHVGFQTAMGFWFKTGVKFEHLEQPIGIEFKDAQERDQFYPFIDFGFANAFGNRLNIDFGFNYFNNDFADSAYETAQYQTSMAYVKVSYPFVKDSSRLYVRYEYTWDNRDSSYQNDLDHGNTLVAGIEGAIPFTQSEKLLGYIELGYSNGFWDSSTDVTRNIETDNNDSKGTGTIRARLRYLMGPKTSMELSAHKGLTFSARGNYQDLWHVDYNVTHNLMRGLVLRLGAYFEHSDPSQGRTITRFGFGLGGRYLLTENFDVFTDLSWSKRNTGQPDYDTDWFVGTVGITMYFK